MGRLRTLADAVLGRSRPARPDLDALFALPTAALTLQSELDFVPTGLGTVCYKGAEGGGFAQAEAKVRALLDADEGPAVQLSSDSYGYTWLTTRTGPDRLSALATDLHAINVTLQDAGFGPNLLCSLVWFTDAPGSSSTAGHIPVSESGLLPGAVGDGEHGGVPAGRRLGLVYLYKQGTWYPFAPAGDQRRDNTVELQVKAALDGELAIEPELGRWFALWDAPGL